MTAEQFDVNVKWMYKNMVLLFFFSFWCSWSNHIFQDSEILEQIDRDVKRTHPDISFFSSKSIQVFSVYSVLTELCQYDLIDCLLFFTLSGISEENSNYIFKIEPQYKICARDEWSFGTSILCIQEWPWPRHLSKLFYHLLFFIPLFSTGSIIFINLLFFMYNSRTVLLIINFR